MLLSFSTTDLLMHLSHQRTIYFFPIFEEKSFKSEKNKHYAKNNGTLPIYLPFI